MSGRNHPQLGLTRDQRLLVLVGRTFFRRASGRSWTYLARVQQERGYGVVRQQDWRDADCAWRLL